MSDVFEPELIQDIASQDSMDASTAESTEDTKPAKKDSIFSMGIFNVMLLLSLIFILWATLNMLGVLRTYSDGFPFSGGVPWNPNI